MSPILVNPAKWPLAKYGDARIWHEWLTSKAGLDAITCYKINGEQLFFPPRGELVSDESTASLNFGRVGQFHDRIGEDKFVAEGYGIDRRDVMYNDFVIVGPNADPAHIRGLKDTRTALAQIAAAKAPFASRGDDSGTNRMELRLWKSAGIQPDPKSGWYRDLGQGMGPTLNIAAGMNAYTLTDRATWANFKNRQNLEILSEGDPALFNPYGSILVNPAKWPNGGLRSGC